MLAHVPRRLASLALLLLSAPAFAYTTKYYVWTNPSAECPTSSSNLPEMDDMIEAWAEEMEDEGWARGGWSTGI